MTGRSGRGIGLRARQLLTAAREGIRNAEERRSAEEVQDARFPVPPRPGAVPGVTINGAAAPGAPHPPDEPPPGPTGPAGGIVPRWLQVAGGWAWRLLFIGIALYLAYRVAGRRAAAPQNR